MAGITVDELNIKVKSSTEQAQVAIDGLAEKLKKLRSGVSGISGTSSRSLQAMQTKLEEIAKASVNLNKLSISLKGVQDFSAAMQVLGTMQVPRLTAFKNAMSAVPEIANAINNMPQIHSENVQNIVNALKPLEAIQKTNLGSTINQIKKLPEVAKALNDIDMDSFAGSIVRAAEALKPLGTEMEKISNGFKAFPSRIQKLLENNDKLAKSNTNVSKSYKGFFGVLSDVRFKIGLIAVVTRKAVSVIGDWTTASNDYIENLNLFNVAMGEGAAAALEYAEAVNKLTGIDVSDWIRNQGVFKSLATGYGIAESAANSMSQTLVQMGYDLSSFYNMDVEEAMNMLQSAIAGEIEPARRRGFALSQASMQQNLYTKGITESVSAMDESSKSLLRFNMLFEQGDRMGVWGDTARTIMTGANAVRILNQQIEQLKRALGNALMPVLMKVLPYVTATVRVLGEMAQELAHWLGFELPQIDYSGVTQVSGGLEDIATQADSATDAVNEFKGTLAGIDQLNIIGSETSANAASAELSGASLDFGTPTYDFLAGLDTESERIYKEVKKNLDSFVSWVSEMKEALGLLGIAFAGIWAYDKAQKFVSWFKGTGFVSAVLEGVKGFDTVFAAGGGSLAALKSGLKGFRAALSPVVKIIAGLAGFVAMFATWKTGIKDVTKGTKSWKDALSSMIPITVAVGAAMYVMLGPVGLVVAAVGGLVGALVGYSEAQQELYEQRLADMWTNDGIAIGEVADAVSEFTTNLTLTEDAYLQNISNLDSTAESAQTMSDKLSIMIADLGSLETVTSEKLNPIKKAFEELAQISSDYIQQSNDGMKLYILANKEMLEAQGISTQYLVDIINQGTQNGLNRVEELQQEAANILDTASQIGSMSDTELSRLSDIQMQIMATYGLEFNMPDIADLTTGLSKLANQEYDLGDPDTLSKAMEQISQSYGEAYSKIETVKNDMLSRVATLDVPESDRKTLSNSILSLFEIKDFELKKAVSPIFQQVGAQLETLDTETRKEIANHLSGDFWSTLLRGNAIAATFMGDFNQQFDDEYNKAVPENVRGYVTNFQTALQTNLSQYSGTIDIGDVFYFDEEKAWEKIQSGLNNARLSSSTDYTQKPPGMPDTVWKYMRPKITSHANGGFVPSSADMFIANENGIPEMVGRIGNRAAVANNDQITNAVASAVESAVVNAVVSLGGFGGNVEIGDTFVIIDGDEVSATVMRRNRNETTRSNGN